jgi:hypothetical protein
MKIQNVKTIGDIENQADSKGRGSVFRACLAIQRSSSTEEIGSKAFELGYNYVAGIDTIKQLKALVDEVFPKSEGEFKQALQALKNALEDAPSIKKVLAALMVVPKRCGGLDYPSVSARVKPT